ncbi:MAG: PspC domain-containing protein [Crocinitomicaceae bacterium]|nr:PspC domain-containing protein [Crocinitomicaceae bacterium]
MLNFILTYFEQKTFGVCSWMGERMGIRPHRIRLYFIYLSFLAFGSPVFVYLVLKFWKENSCIFKPWKWRRRFATE